MINREAISRTKRLFRETNADSRLSNRLIYSLLINHAKWLIYRESDKFKLVKSDDVFQPYKCIEVIEAPVVDECCGIKSYCTVYRTKDKIPKIYEDSSGIIVKSLTTVDSRTSLTKIKSSEWNRKQNNPWIPKDKKNKFYFFSNGYLYFPNGSWKMVEMIALFKEDISDLNLCDKCLTCEDESKPCKRFLDKNFIIPEYLEAQMFDGVVKDLVEIYKKFAEKSTNIDKNDNK